MTTSGTYTFNPNLGNLVAQAYRRARVKRADLTAEHMLDGVTEANLMLVDWANKGVNLWKVELFTFALTAGVATYVFDQNTVDVLDAYLSVPNGDGTYTDRQMTSISRSEYAAYPNKNLTGSPSTFWFNRLVTPEATLYLVPDQSTYLFKGYRMLRMQDASATDGQTVDVQYLWLDAFVAGLAARVGAIWADPALVPVLAAQAQMSWQTAAEENVEDASFYIVPGIGSYYR